MRHCYISHFLYSDFTVLFNISIIEMHVHFSLFYLVYLFVIKCYFNFTYAILHLVYYLL